MGKSLSSSKKIKHSTDSSKLRSVKKKKTKRNKPKKIRRIKDYSDESESSGSDSSLYSSSEDDYRRKKKRSSKLSKKRSRKRYSSSSESDDEDDDDDVRVVKKKKGSKKKDGHVRKKKKKIVSRKRRKRDSSLSSTSSEQSGDDGSESDDGKRRSRERGRLGKVTDARRRSRDDLEGDSERDECLQVEDEVMTVKNPRRLKSIVVVSYTYDNDQRKEEDDHDDVYLTRGGNRELGYSEESDERDAETTISYSQTRDDDNRSKTVGYDDFFGESNKSESSKASHPENRIKDADLEAILKKRALENLKRFRGVARKEVSSVSEGEPLQIESERFEQSQEHGLVEQKLCDSAGSKDPEYSQNMLRVVNVKEPGTSLTNIASQQDQQSGDTTKVKASSGISSCTTIRKLIRPVLGKERVINLASGEVAASSQDTELVSINDSTIEKNCRPESSLALETKNGGENIEPKVSSTLNAESSSHADTATLDEIKGGSQSEQKPIDETKDESQYEKKTMSVMRGGEMVQVSYKVYIPKKISSLGRRQLKR